VTPQRVCTFLPLVMIAASVPAFSVTIQYSGGFDTGSGNLTGVANLSGCSGALLADGMHVLTAAHCVANISVVGGQTVLTSDGISSLKFFTSSTPTGVTDGVTGVHFNPLTQYMFPSDAAHSLLMYDVALLDLAAPAPADATRYNLDLSGFAIANNSPVTLGGWGLGGYPGGSVLGTGGTRRGGTNNVAGVFTTADDPFLTGDPTVTLTDQPIALLWHTTNDTSTPSDTTGLGNAGDSGGPLLYNGNLIGVLDFGDLPRSGPPPAGADIVQLNTTYENGFANLSNPGNANWLQSELYGPEPGTFLMAAGAMALLLFRKVRMKARAQQHSIEPIGYYLPRMPHPTSTGSGLS
jgi:Trypsin